jgi:hypothetical protein
MLCEFTKTWKSFGSGYGILSTLLCVNYRDVALGVGCFDEHWALCQDSLHISAGERKSNHARWTLGQASSMISCASLYELWAPTGDEASDRRSNPAEMPR